MASLPDTVSMREKQNASQQIVFQGFSRNSVLNVFKWICMDITG